MRLFILLIMPILVAAPAAAQNLLENPQFNLDPTVPGHGWTVSGTGTAAWVPGAGDPEPPSVRTTQSGAESMSLFQCVEIVGGLTYDFWTRSYTHSSIGAARNGVRLVIFAATGCSGAELEIVGTDTNAVPNWYQRLRLGYVAPPGAGSALFELYSEANGDNNDISWDDTMLREHVVAAEKSSWGTLKALYR